MGGVSFLANRLLIGRGVVRLLVVSLPIGWGASVVLALHSLAGGNGPCPSLERSLDPKRRRLRPRPQPKTRGQWRLGQVRDGGVVVVVVVVTRNL